MPWDYGLCSRCSHRTRVWSKDQNETDTWLCQQCLDDDDKAWFNEEAQRDRESEYPPDKD